MLEAQVDAVITYLVSNGAVSDDYRQSTQGRACAPEY